MIIEYILVLGITMITSACTVYLRDLEHIIGVFMMAWIYLTPVMYDISFIPDGLSESNDINSDCISRYFIL